MKKVLSILLIAIALTSCMCTKTVVGNFREAPGTEVHYSRAKQIYIFGIFPVGHPSADTPKSGNCIVTTHRNIWDFIIPFVTVGIVQTYTIDITAKMTEAEKPAN